MSSAAKATTSCGGAGSSSATFQIPPGPPASISRIATPAISSTWTRLNTWPGLTIRRASPRRSLSTHCGQAHRCRRAAGCRRHAARFAESAPFAFGREPPSRARRPRRRRAQLVDPGPVAVAVDAHAGEIDDARQRRRGGDRRAKRCSAGSPFSSGGALTNSVSALRSAASSADHAAASSTAQAATPLWREARAVSGSRVAPLASTPGSRARTRRAA